MFLPSIFNSMEQALNDSQVNEILKIGEENGECKLVLTKEDAVEIIKARNRTLQSNGRIELGIEVMKKLIQNFSVSSFVHQEDYVSIINELQEIFYYMKNETEDKLGDDELIDIMEKLYNNSCGGSIELLKETIELFAINFRGENQKKDNELFMNYLTERWKNE